jgi:hypothetical protein
VQLLFFAWTIYQILVSLKQNFNKLISGLTPPAPLSRERGGRCKQDTGFKLLEQRKRKWNSLKVNPACKVTPSFLREGAGG